MNISMQSLLGKIEEELKQAKQSDSEVRTREKIYAIKTLCELVLEQKTSRQSPAPIIEPQRAVQYQQPAKMKVDDEANGDSLFDF
ncbi:hypothetical protein J27TS8_31160 [Robertmurraya siralis]|uniref:YwdI family protein n=1 Tax=Robertmurraya siralis TaxID=77777 RepID=A0A920BUN9_9BACI|nr:YwdI family protein [Robertmurraya siralis]PAE19695.1 hypothetical protein CHH80_15725 [Bacillus sp. 7504-2]GIN63123.1 hypothetical protein J27TS8_31160 [Robertmurraya siralis]